MDSLKDNEKIGVIILGYLGDVVNSSAVFRRIKEVNPTVSLSILTLTSSIPAARGILEIDNIYSFNKSVKFSMINTVKFALSLRNRFDTVIVLDNSLRSAYCAFFTGAKRRIGRGGELRELFLNDLIPYLQEEKKMEIPVAEHFTRCLKPLGLYKENIDIGFNFSQEDNQAALKLLEDYNLTNRKILGFCPACHKADKSMKLEDIKTLIKKINDENEYKVAIIGGRDITKAVNKLKDDNSLEFYDFTGKTKFTQTAALIDKCSKFVSIDSSCMHLALARKVPTLAIFFSNAYKKWGPSDLTRNALYVNEKSADTDIDEIMDKLHQLKSL